MNSARSGSPCSSSQSANTSRVVLSSGCSRMARRNTAFSFMGRILFPRGANREQGDGAIERVLGVVEFQPRAIDVDSRFAKCLTLQHFIPNRRRDNGILTPASERVSLPEP